MVATKTAWTSAICAWTLVAVLVLAGRAFAADPGVTKSEIKIGNIMPYSGNASAYGTIGKGIAAYVKKLNEEGGINGRKINFITYDDGYTPARAVEQARRLVEQDQVLFIFQSLGTPSNSAIWKYMNDKRVPQLFVASGATKWGDPVGHPWTMGWQPTYQTEARIYAQYLLKANPGAKVAVLLQNDDFGKDYLKGFKDGLGAAAAKMIVAEQTYEVTDPTVDSQIVNLKNSGADVFLNVTTPKFALQAIKKAADLGWKPLQFLTNVSSSLATVMKPAGTEASKGIVSAFYLKDYDDPQWKDDPATKEWFAWLKKYYPDGNEHDQFNIYAYCVSQTLVQVLKQAGDDLSRANVMKQAANIKDFTLPMLLPGIKVNSSPTDFFPIEQERLGRFDGERWVLFGDLIDSSGSRLSRN
jgi:ABC-type branched-subunit amino acid transport system substrate-binding protein